MKKIQLIIPLLVVMLPGIAFALDDTPENRAAEIERYMRAVPPVELMQDMATNMAQTLPPELREDFQRLMLVHVDNDKIVEAMKNSMIKHFTADELAAIADLYETPAGKSAMEKMGVYMADVYPIIMAEMKKAMQALKAEKQNQAVDSQ